MAGISFRHHRCDIACRELLVRHAMKLLLRRYGDMTGKTLRAFRTRRPILDGWLEGLVMQTRVAQLCQHDSELIFFFSRVRTVRAVVSQDRWHITCHDTSHVTAVAD